MLSADLQDLFQLSLSCIDILLRIAASLHYPLRIPRERPAAYGPATVALTQCMLHGVLHVQAALAHQNISCVQERSTDAAKGADLNQV